MELIFVVALLAAAAFYVRKSRKPAPSAGNGRGDGNRWADGFSLNIVGESHCQPAIRRSREGEPVDLRREPSNPHDPNAVRVLSARGEPLGYLSRERAHWLGRKMDRGAQIRAEIKHITGGGPRESLGVVLQVWLTE